jgi:hypothetical protein
MSLENLLAWARQFDHFADVLIRTTQQHDPAIIKVDARRAVVQAARLVTSIVDRGDHFQAVRAACMAHSLRDGNVTPLRDLTADKLFLLWKKTLTAWLRSERPDLLKDTGEFDWNVGVVFGKRKTDHLGPEGKRYKMLPVVAHLGPYGPKEQYTPAQVVAQLRQQANDWATCCRALGLMLREASCDAVARADPGADGEAQRRLRFDPLTWTITLDGKDCPIENHAAFIVYRTIATHEGPITRAEIREKTGRFRGQKTVRNLIETLPQALRDTVVSDQEGFHLRLQPAGK